MSLAIKDACNVTLVDRITKVPLYHTKDLNTFTVKFEGESVYAKAKGENKIAFDGALTGTLNMEAEVVQFDQLAVILASTVETGATDIGGRRVLTVDGSNKATLEGIKPLQGSLSAFLIDADGVSHLESLKFTSATVGENTELTINSPGMPEGTKVAVYYMLKKPNTKKIVIRNESTAPNYMLYGDAACKTDQGQMVAMALTLPNLKVKRSIEMSFTAENPSNFNTELDILPDENGEYMTLAFIGNDPNATFRNIRFEETEINLKEDTTKK